MKLRSIISYGVILLGAGCIDRINFPLEVPISRVVISGFVSTEPGPYVVKVSESVDIQSPYVFSKPIALQSMVLVDNLGNTDTLTDRIDEVGTYYTHENGMRGVAGRAYKLMFETRDGRKYESTFDTIPAKTGTIDSVYSSFDAKTDIQGGTTYGFDMHFNSSNIESGRTRYMWKLIATYKVDTDPKNYRAPCAGAAPDCPNPVVSCGCPSPLACSGYEPAEPYPSIVYRRPCTCCTCWVTINNETPLLLMDQSLYGTRLTNFNAGFIPLTEFTFMYKVHAKVEQQALSSQAFACFRSILNQQEASGSLFQPTIGRIVGNIVQTSGEPIPAEGIFYATSISSKAIYIRQLDIPNPRLIPKDTEMHAKKKSQSSCLDFPNSTTTRPSFWVD